MVYETAADAAPDDARLHPGARHALADLRGQAARIRFRIDPNARLSDGQPVTADDVVATWKLHDGQDPAGLRCRSWCIGKFEQPVAESKYIVRGEEPRRQNWRNFLYFCRHVRSTRRTC